MHRSGPAGDGNVAHLAPFRGLLVWRRVGATAIDYTLLAAWAAMVAVASLTSGAALTLEALPVGGLQLVGLLTVTVPGTLALAWAEKRGASPGKRLLQLRLESVDGRTVTTVTALLRTAAKVALPWELAHTGVWRLVAGSDGPLAVTAIGLAYVVLAATMAGLFTGRAWYDRLGHTRVVGRPSPTAHVSR